MKNKLSFISLFLAAVMLLGALSACKGNTETPTDSTPAESTETESTEGGTTAAETAESDTEQIGETEEDTTPKIEGENADLIERADRLANTVQSYYTDASRDHYVMENKEMILEYARNCMEAQQVTALKSKAGKTYLENTMDVFVKMTDGSTYYASNSIISASTNIYRLGYYYYENRISNQIFIGNDGESSALDIDIYRLGSKSGVKNLAKSRELVSFEITDSSDPWISFSKVKFAAEDYKYLQITMKANGGIGSNPQVFIIAGSKNNYTADQSINFSLTADGQYHTYTIPLYTVTDYTGDVRGLRLDINGTVGSTYEITSVRAVSLGESCPENLSLNRSFLTYSDKLHQIIQIAAGETTTGIAEVGMVTTLAADTVAKLTVKDKNGAHTSLDGVDWDGAEYVGFDIVDAGIFGYILPYDGRGGRLEVTLADGVYTIVQTMTPAGGTIRPSLVDSDNKNDFYMGQRIYTDTSHDFEEFLHEAECERNPLTAQNFTVDNRTYNGSKFLGYDSLYGYYKFSTPPAGGFNGPFYEYPNRHFGVQFTVKGDQLDRNIYLCAHTTSGSLECAALLNGDGMMLPVPLEVAKNFKGDGEDNIFMLDDDTYGEVFLPLIVKSNTQKEYTVLQLYQNWGKFPLKQISSIQYFSPYYHLSTGVTETNCVVVFGSSGLSLPDFRSMSAPFWKSQPQHNSCGSHSIVQYTNAEGVKISNQIETVDIDSYGPTYADMNVDFITDDGAMRVNYSHLELPQTDENRTFFEIKIDILADVSFKNFKEDFYFYNVKPNDPTGYYTQVGYLDTSNKSRVVAANDSKESIAEYILGSECPYFSFFNMVEYTASYIEGYSNVAMLINSSEFIIGGEKSNAPLVLLNPYKNLRLSLNLGEVTLKKGDSLTLTGILLPWGSQECEYKDGDGTAPDQNVRNVRNDSLVNAMKGTAVENCTVEESTFLPRFRTTDGKSATFKISGGNNNIATRVYGFDTLTVPKIYELVDGKWVDYKVASINSIDQAGYGYNYDGYTVYYDGDGTYSYSFAFASDNGQERTFKIVADTAFEGWGEEDNPVISDLPLNVYITPDNLTSVGATLAGFETVKDGDVNVFRFKGDGSSKEKSITPYKVSSLYESSGQYVVFKYRMPESNQTALNFFEVYVSTQNTGATGVGDLIRCVGTVIKDGEWHVLVVDASHLATYAPFSDGTYLAQFLRIDLLDGGSSALPESEHIDVAYVGISDSLEDICKLNADMPELMLYQNGALKTVNTATGAVTGEESKEENKLPESTDLLNVYVPAQVLGQKTNGVAGCAYELLGNGSFVRYYGKGSQESYLTVYSNSAGDKITGQYLVYKYRIPTDIPQHVHQIEVFAGTQAAAPTGNGDRIQASGYIQNGEWQLMIVDASGFEAFKDNAGTYNATYIRFDVMNQRMDSTGYVDVAYFGAADSIEKILEFNSDMEYYTLITVSGTKRYDMNGEEIKAEETTEKETEAVETEVETENAPTLDDSASPAPADASVANVYISASDLNAVNSSGCTWALSADGNYVRFAGKGSAESISQVYSNKSGDKVTGQYVVIKYRVPTSNAASLTNIEVFTGTVATAPVGTGDQQQFGSVIKDNQWHVAIYDVSTFEQFKAVDGTYSAKYLRVDFLNRTADADTCIDIAYVAMVDSVEDALAMNANMDSVTLLSGTNVETLNTK